MRKFAEANICSFRVGIRAHAIGTKTHTFCLVSSALDPKAIYPWLFHIKVPAFLTKINPEKRLVQMID